MQKKGNGHAKIMSKPDIESQIITQVIQLSSAKNILFLDYETIATCCVANAKTFSLYVGSNTFSGHFCS